MCLAYSMHLYIALPMYRVSNKSTPPLYTTFDDIFAWAESFCIKFCTFIGNLYPRMCTDFRLFIFTFNEMALILSRAPIIFTVSSLDCSVGNKNAEYQLKRKWRYWPVVSNRLQTFLTKLISPFMIRVTGDNGFWTKPLLPKRLDVQFIVIRQLSHYYGQ